MPCNKSKKAATTWSVLQMTMQINGVNPCRTSLSIHLGIAMNEDWLKQRKVSQVIIAVQSLNPIRRKENFRGGH